MSELLSCPFCDEKPNTTDYGRVGGVVWCGNTNCPKYPYETGVMKSLDNAIKSWNANAVAIREGSAHVVNDGKIWRVIKMPTNEERREVAKELRKYSTNDLKCYVDAICELAISTGVDCMGLDACHGSDEMPECKKRLFDRLADLIEPEPERTITPVLDKSSWYIWRCPECGQPINGADNYCSSCGVKVTPTPL